MGWDDGDREEAQVKKQEIERLLSEGLHSPVSEMTAEDWASIRREALERPRDLDPELHSSC